MLSGLVGAWLGVHVAKRIVRYPLRTGDLFAPAVALALAIGRFGCFFTEKPGTPTGASWGIVLDPDAAARVGAPAGVPLHPSFLYEIAFHAAAFAVLWFWLRHQPIAAGETLTLYVAAYAIFRFFVEFVRGNEVVWLGLTRPQLFLLVTIPLVLARIAWIASRGAFRRNPERMVAQWTDRLRTPPPTTRLPKGLGPSEPAAPAEPPPEDLGPEEPAAPSGSLPATRHPGRRPCRRSRRSPRRTAGLRAVPPPAAPDAFPAAPEAPTRPQEKDSRPRRRPRRGDRMRAAGARRHPVLPHGGLIPAFFGALWPFILVTIGAALLMLSKRWRRFATGVLIVAAAPWIVVIGPCIALLSPGLWGA